MTQPRPMAGDGLILSHFSLLGLEDFETRVHSAAAAGFDGIGLYIGEYLRLRESGLTDADMQRILAAANSRVIEIEVLTHWCPLSDAGQRLLNTACHMGELFSARHVAVNGPYEGSLVDAAATFARLCDACAEAGLLVSLEHLPFNNVGTLATSLAIVGAAGRDNGGVCLDSWHHFRGAADWSLLGEIPREQIASVQLNDGATRPENPDYLADTISNRRIPGEGGFDLQRFVTAIREQGWQGPFSVEVLSERLRALPPDQVCRRLYAATKTLLDGPGDSTGKVI